MASRLNMRDGYMATAVPLGMEQASTSKPKLHVRLCAVQAALVVVKSSVYFYDSHPPVL